MPCASIFVTPGFSSGGTGKLGSSALEDQGRNRPILRKCRWLEHLALRKSLMFSMGSPASGLSKRGLEYRKKYKSRLVFPPSP